MTISKQIQGSTLSRTRHVLAAKKDDNTTLQFSLVSNNLGATNYHYDSTDAQNYSATSFGFAMSLNGNGANIYYDGDMLAMNISSFANNRIPGSFSAILSSPPFFDYKNKGTILITEGKINNVQVVE